jgi:hypothetical protein
LIQLARMALVVLLAGLILTACGAPRADIAITSSGCGERFTLPSTREPVISVVNQTDAPMVLTIPRMVRFVTVAPGATAQFELPRYIMGEFEFFCLGEPEHLALSGGNPFLCAAEPAQVAPVALSGGVFVIEPHERIKELAAPSS